MITVANTYFQTKIELSPENVLLLIIENPEEYFNTVCEFQKAMEGEQSEFTFWEGVTQLQPNKFGELLLSAFSFELSDRKILTLLYKKLQKNFLDGEFIVNFNALNAQIGVFLQSICQTVDFSLDYSELVLEDLLKVCNVKPTKVYESFLEKLICYINIFTELKNIKFFIFIGLKDILSDENLTLLYHHCVLQKVGLLLIESSKKRNLLPMERAIIITDDLCEIVENFGEM